jgi:hypothetical protein
MYNKKNGVLYRDSEKLFEYLLVIKMIVPTGKTSQ